MGFNPAPSVTKLRHLADLNIDSVFANPLIPLHGPFVANVFESVFELRRVRWDSNNFGVQGPLPDISTAQDMDQACACTAGVFSFDEALSQLASQALAHKALS